VAIARDKSEIEHKMKALKRKMLRERAEVIVHPAHKRAIPVPMSEGEGPSRAKVRVAKLRAEMDLTPISTTDAVRRLR